MIAIRAESRDLSVDIARGIGILLVLYGHGADPLLFHRTDGFFDDNVFYQWRTIYSFHMPLFFMLSGLVSKNIASKSPEDILTRLLFLIGIALSAHIVGSVLLLTGKTVHGHLNDVLSLKSSNDILFVKSVIDPVLRGYYFHTIVVWFLVSLAMVTALGYICLRYKVYGPLVVTAILAIAAVLTYQDVENFWQFQSWAPGFVFFILGVSISRIPARSAILAAVILLGLTIVTAPLNRGCPFDFTASCPEYVLKDKFGVFMIVGQIGFVPAFFITGIMGCLGTYYLSIFIETTRNLSRGLAWLGKYSLELMLVNGFVLEFATPVVRAMPPMNSLTSGIIILLEVVAQILIVVLIRHPLRTFETYLRMAAAMVSRLVVTRVPRFSQ